MGLPWWLSGKESTCNAGDSALIPGSGRSPGGGHGTTPVFLPGESQGQRSLMGYSLPDSSVHGILQARILGGLPFPSPGDLPDPGIEPRPPTL